MQRNVKEALERIERAQSFSHQPRFGAAIDKDRFFSSFYHWIKKTECDMPSYSADSRARDKWLSEAWMKEPHIAGVVGSVVAIDRNRDWSLTGGRNVVNRYTSILRDSEEGEGWRYFCGRASLSFYTSDIGSITEIGREGPDGPLRALYNVDPTLCKLTGDREFPLTYRPQDKELKWRAMDFFRTAPLPTVRESYNGLGYCAISRVWAYGQMLIAVYEHDMEQLGAKAPKGLLLLQNIGEQQWIDAMKARSVELSKAERDYYGGIAVLAQEGVDQIDAKLVALSQLPAGFNIEVTTKLLMLGIALGFEYDPIEFWPVETGALGRSRESELQHTKATGKGGIEFVRTFQDRLQGELPPTIFFEFEHRDIAGEMAEAQVQQAWATVFATYYDKGVGTLDKEEARQLMVRRGIIPAEWTTAEEQAQSDSSGEQRSWHNLEAVWRSIFTRPQDSIVRYNYKTNRTTTLAPSGYAVVKQHAGSPIARAVYDEYPTPEFRELFSYRVFPVPVSRKDDDILFSEDDAEISMDDVLDAINKGKKRVGKEFSALMLAEVEE